MSLTDFSTVVVSAQGAGLTQIGFGTLLIAGYHTHNTDRSRTYTDLAGMVTDGFATDEPLYLAATVAFSQNPRPTSIKIGRLANAPVYSQRITPVEVNGATYSFGLAVQGEDPVTISFTADGSATVDEICDGLESAINAASLAGITVTPSGATATHLTVSATAGLHFAFSDWDRALVLIEDLTPDPGVAADLAAIRTADEGWYGLSLAHNNKAMIEAASAWAETLKIVFAANTSDHQAENSGSTADVWSGITSAARMRTIVAFDADDQDGFSGVALLAERFPWDPGAPPAAGGVVNGRTWRGVTADSLTPTQKANLRAKKYTVYITTAGRNHALGGEMGGGEFFDYVRFLDWYVVRLQEKLAALQLNNQRVPFDSRGLTMVQATAEAQLTEGLRSGGISPFDANGNEPVVFVPPLSATTSEDRANRVLNGVVTTFMYAGAIQKVNATVVVTP